jgi:hypothetical protein
MLLALNIWVAIITAFVSFSFIGGAWQGHHQKQQAKNEATIQTTKANHAKKDYYV